jgi:hypothetical protein
MAKIVSTHSHLHAWNGCGVLMEYLGDVLHIFYQHEQG